MRWRGVGVSVALAGISLLWRLGPFRVEVRGRSMEPTLRSGDYLVAVRARSIRRGDVVVVLHPTGDFEVVKRVIGIPGERVRSERGRWWVGDRLIDGVGPTGGPSSEWTLAPGRYLLVGDNPAASTDGRAFGSLAGGQIAGKVVYRYWPRPGPVR